jgi:alpha-beta hydrolase superfamily lysophospholipase
VTPRSWEQWVDHYEAKGYRVVTPAYPGFVSGRVLWASVLANVQPGHQDTYVDYKNDDRAPLLFVSGSEDNIMPPKVQRSNAKHYKSDTVTEVKEYDGFAHLLPAQEGWQQVADDVLEWAVAHARTGAPVR